MIRKKECIRFLIAFSIFLSFVGCEDADLPKPRGYFRIQLDEPKYQLFRMNDYPYIFEISDYAMPVSKNLFPEKKWINISYPKFNAQIHITYKSVSDNLDTLLNDMHSMINKHIPKSNAINERMYVNSEKKVYGMSYTIKGSEAASPYQFFATDSTHHFLRGSLYFNFSPNNDSLKPVIDFLISDMRHLIETIEWRDPREENQSELPADSIGI
jgi:gliding motility-associated lipoprotein GldD